LAPDPGVDGDAGGITWMKSPTTLPG